jgi:hypothetical protein
MYMMLNHYQLGYYLSRKNKNHTFLFLKSIINNYLKFILFLILIHNRPPISMIYLP